MEKQLSIIIPVYNTAECLKRNLESLLKQDLEKEIIIIDDGSTDESYRIAKKYADIYHDIKVVKQENSGQSAARNRGLEIATGEYIFFCDSDDYIDENSLKNLYEICKKYNLDILKTGWKTLTGKNVQINNPPKNGIEMKQVLTSYKYFQESIRCWYNVIPVNGFYKNRFLRKNQIFFPEGVQFEDNTFHLKTLLSDLKARVMQIEQPFYNVCVRDGSTTTETVVPKKIYDQLENIRLMNDFIENSNFDKELFGLAKIAVSSLVFTMTNYYYRVDKQYRKELRQVMPKRILKDAIFYPQNKFQQCKVFAFLYMPLLLDAYEFFRMRK